MRLSARPGKTPVIAVTSGAGGEGKTLVASCLARSLAATGLRTLLLDANLTAPGVAAEFGARPVRTVDTIGPREEVEIGDFVRHDGPSGIDLICAGTSNGPAEHILGHGGFARLLTTLRSAYDVVVIDSTAVSNGSGALLVSALADRTILVVPQGADRTETDRAIRKFGTAGLTIDGLVVNGACRATLERSNVVSFANDHAASTADGRKRMEMPVDLPSIVGM
nr:CpsD/CapB family tyrosine-protein kinase [Shinella sumterensis]